MTYKNEGLQRISEELEKTAVISKDFKSFIMGWASHAVGIGYENGRGDRKELRDQLNAAEKVAKAAAAWAYEPEGPERDQSARLRELRAECHTWKSAR